MKKQFFYAAMAVALMASCTSEDNLSVDPIIPDEDDKVAIQLGVDAPTVNATVGRAVGSVGDTEGASNVWNGERLFITMVDKETDSVAVDVDGAQAVLNHLDYAYYAPRGSVNATDSGSVRIYKNVAANLPATDGNGQGTLSYVYYPVSGQYDFYGWHLDDANSGEGDADPVVTIKKGVKTVKGIKITGQQDIMGARTREFTEENYFNNNVVTANYADMVGWDFSARTARNKIHPVLKFEHQLARLKFFVKAGSDKTAKYKYVNGAWVENQSDETVAQSTAMMVKSIKVVNVINTIDMNLDGRDAKTGKPAVTASAVTAEVDTFTLGSRNAQGIMTDLVATAPKYYCTVDNPTAPADNDYADHKAGTQVGESVMFFPGTNSSKTVDLEVELAQIVQTLDQENGNDNDKWEEKSQTAKLKVHASSLFNQNGNNIFEPGKSYNVYITIYGFERIEITAELTAWENGGDVNVDVEEGQSRHNVDVTFNVLDENNGAIANANITATYSYKNNAGETVPDQTATFTAGDEAGSWVATVPSFAVLNYTITADGYETATGYANAKNGNDVTITMKATGTATEPEEPNDEPQATIQNITFSFNFSDGYNPDASVIKSITVVEKDANPAVEIEPQGGYYAVTVGKTYVVTVASDYYTQDESTKEFTIVDEQEFYSITLHPIKKDITIDVTDKETYQYGFSLVVTEDGYEQPTAPKEEGGNVYSLKLGREYVVTYSGSKTQGGQVVTKEHSFTVGNEETVSFAFDNAGGGAGDEV